MAVLGMIVIIAILAVGIYYLCEMFLHMGDNENED